MDENEEDTSVGNEYLNSFFSNLEGDKYVKNEESIYEFKHIPTLVVMLAYLTLMLIGMHFKSMNQNVKSMLILDPYHVMIYVLCMMTFLNLIMLSLHLIHHMIVLKIMNFILWMINMIFIMMRCLSITCIPCHVHLAKTIL